MSFTFYVAASSKNVDEVRRCMAELEQRGGRNMYDWTVNLNDPIGDYPKLAQKDLAAAIDALVFVYLADPMSYGGMTELGARFAVGKNADVIGASEHLFFHHPQVFRYATWDEFMQRLWPD